MTVNSQVGIKIYFIYVADFYMFLSVIIGGTDLKFNVHTGVVVVIGYIESV